MGNQITNTYIKLLKLSKGQRKQLAQIQKNITDNVRPPADPDYWHRMLDEFYKRLGNQNKE